MLTDLKEQLIGDPKLIIELLEEYGFTHITPKITEIRCARDEIGGSNISIKLGNNSNVTVHDYARSFTSDIIGYIMKEKHVDFKTVLQSIKRILNLSDDWQQQQHIPLFGGFYNSIGVRTETYIKTYDDSILDKYIMVGNDRFLRDHIDLSTQRIFNVGYDIETQRIIFPIRNEMGDIIGIKGRRNYDTEDKNDPKYLYLIPCPMSQTLYGYNVNYSHMYNNEVMIVEAEKTVQQLYSYGYYNAVAIGSNALSEKQAQLVLQLNPTKIIMALDEGLEFSQTEKNLKLLQSFSMLRDTQYYYWDSTQDNKIKETKNSPGDMGAEYFNMIYSTQLKNWVY